VAEGLVASRPRFGYQVTPITLTDIREIFGVREAVEPMAAELACQRLTETELGRLEELCASPGAGDDFEAIIARNREFHLLIARACGNRRLAHVIEQLIDESQRFLFYQLLCGYPLQQAPIGHQQLVDVLRSRDPAAARRLAANAASSAAANLIDLIASSPSVQACSPVWSHGLSKG
jgi:DNA-binding GntR family transcriptional regulator